MAMNPTQTSTYTEAPTFNERNEMPKWDDETDLDGTDDLDEDKEGDVTDDIDSDDIDSEEIFEDNEDDIRKDDDDDDDDDLMWGDDDDDEVNGRYFNVDGGDVSEYAQVLLARLDSRGYFV